MESTRQRYNLEHFHFTGYRCVEKFMTRFWIDGRTIKRGKLVCISIISCHLSNLNLHRIE